MGGWEGERERGVIQKGVRVYIRMHAHMSVTFEITVLHILLLHFP